MMFNISILPLIIGAVFNMVLGSLWYSPLLFAKVYFFTTIGSFVTSYVIGF